MKKIRNLVMLLTVILLLTGCVKYNVNMDIKKDKSMEFKIVYALDTSVLGEKANFSDEDLKKMKDQGFEVSKYSEGNMKGVTLTKKIKNIDDVSSVDGTEYSLSGILNNGTSKMFKVKKGLLKNKYTAKFDFDSSDSGLQNSNNTFEKEENDDDDNAILDAKEEENDNDDNKLDADEEDAKEESINISDNLNGNEDYSKMMANMDLSFTVTLPYKAISNNATTVKNDGKELVWNLAANNEKKSIEFEFEIDRFSIMPIVIIVGCILGGLFVIALIVTIIMAVQGGKKPKTPIQNTETKE